MPKCRHVVFEDVRIDGAGGAVLAQARGVCALKREGGGFRLRVLSAHRESGLTANDDDDGCPVALQQKWRRCGCYEHD